MLQPRPQPNWKRIKTKQTNKQTKKKQKKKPQSSEASRTGCKSRQWLNLSFLICELGRTTVPNSWGFSEVKQAMYNERRAWSKRSMDGTIYYLFLTLLYQGLCWWKDQTSAPPCSSRQGWKGIRKKAFSQPGYGQRAGQLLAGDVT